MGIEGCIGKDWRGAGVHVSSLDANRGDMGVREVEPSGGGRMGMSVRSAKKLLDAEVISGGGCCKEPNHDTVGAVS